MRGLVFFLIGSIYVCLFFSWWTTFQVIPEETYRHPAVDREKVLHLTPTSKTTLPDGLSYKTHRLTLLYPETLFWPCLKGIYNLEAQHQPRGSSHARSQAKQSSHFERWVWSIKSHWGKAEIKVIPKMAVGQKRVPKKPYW